MLSYRYKSKKQPVFRIQLTLAHPNLIALLCPNLFTSLRRNHLCRHQVDPINIYFALRLQAIHNISRVEQLMGQLVQFCL